MRNVSIVGLAAVLFACSNRPTDAEILLLQSALQPLELSSGTSFGECLGYCRTELDVDSLTLTLVEVPQGQQELPIRTRTLPLALADWTRVRSLVDAAALERLEGTHGCPDCADGGAEWIEVETTTGPVRVTFEYGAALAGIAPLQTEIRALRARFPR